MNNKDLIQQQFGANAAAYATSTIHAKGASLSRLVELTAPQKSWQVLDIATGAGHTAFAFAPYVAHVTASDLTREMLSVAKKLAKEKEIKNLDFKEADAEALPFEPASFDLVTCRIAPHHFTNPHLFVIECARVLKPDGVVAIVDNVVPTQPDAANFINAFEKFRDPSHVCCLSIDEWTNVLEQTGLNLIHTEEAKKEMDFKAWADNMNVSEEARTTLREMLERTAGQAAEFLSPRFLDNGEIKFMLAEGIFIARKEKSHE